MLANITHLLFQCLVTGTEHMPSNLLVSNIFHGIGYFSNKIDFHSLRIIWPITTVKFLLLSRTVCLYSFYACDFRVIFDVSEMLLAFIDKPAHKISNN